MPKTWNFAIVGCDSNDIPRYLDFAETYEEAVTRQETLSNTAAWTRLAIFDAYHEEVKEKP
jgi:hypothetical protein